MVRPLNFITSRASVDLYRSPFHLLLKSWREGESCNWARKHTNVTLEIKPRRLTAPFSQALIRVYGRPWHPLGMRVSREWNCGIFSHPNQNRIMAKIGNFCLRLCPPAKESSQIAGCLRLCDIRWSIHIISYLISKDDDLDWERRRTIILRCCFCGY